MSDSNTPLLYRWSRRPDWSGSPGGPQLELGVRSGRQSGLPGSKQCREQAGSIAGRQETGSPGPRQKGAGLPGSRRSTAVRIRQGKASLTEDNLVTSVCVTGV